jgi:hypothetical protein
VKLARGVIVATVATAALGVGAQQGAPRAWQQRIDVAVDLPVPVIGVESANPFAIAVDQAPQLTSSEAPRKLDVSGRAVVAAYVDAKGECLGGVPLELPFPGLTTDVLDEVTGERFDTARIGDREVPSWIVIGFDITGRVKESTVGTPSFELPDPALPPEPSEPLRVAPPGSLVRAPYEPQSSLTKLATPRRLRIRAPGQEVDIPIRALVHITAGGRCDRFVPLNLDSGLHSWLSAYLATWRLEPALLDGEPHDAWVIYSARAQLKLSSLDSTVTNVLRDRSFTPPSSDD